MLWHRKVERMQQIVVVGIMSVVLGVVVGIITNYIYEQLRRTDVLPAKPTGTVFLVLTLFVLASIPLAAWLNLGSFDVTSIATMQQSASPSITMTSRPTPTVMSPSQATITMLTPTTPTASPTTTATATPQPLVPGGRIAFDGFGHDIYAINSDGSNQVLLSRDGITKHSPNWSPDGARIAFVSLPEGSARISVMDANGANLTVIDNVAPALYPDWSPDGERIAFTSGRYPGLSSDVWDEVYVMNADGSDTRKLTNDEYPDYHPDWSPDGSLIVFTSYRNSMNVIYKMNADGSSPEALTSSGDNYQPVWSPDGNHIAFVSERDGNAEIYIMNADGSNQINISRNEVDDLSPAWSPDGKYIAFSSDLDEGGIYIIDVNGFNQRKLVRFGSNPTWSR